MNSMSTNSQTNGGKPRLSNAQKQALKKYAVYALMGIICAGCMWLIFAPSAEEKNKQEQRAGFNADVPLPKEEGLIGDKRDAYEKEQMKQKQAERMRSLEDFSAMLGGGETQTPSDDLVLLDSEPAKPKTGGTGGTQGRSIQNSAQTYRDMNRTLSSFYEKPREDPEKEALRQELEELKARMDESETRKNSVDNQLEMMEKSFQMASKYMPGMSGTQGAPPAAEPASAGAGTGNASGKTAVATVKQAGEQTVSALLPEMSGAAFIETYSEPRNMGFLTATAQTGIGKKNTISACIHANQSVMSGQSVRLRLLEPVHAGGMYIPRNMLLSGMAKIQGERLEIIVNSLENSGQILPVSLTVYDLDGQAGIFIPNLQELSAAKEIVANIGTNAGTSINLSNDAGEQFVADMGRNLIQGVSQFTAKKLREVKVHLKAGYRVFLLPEGNLTDSQKRMANNK
jgi:conjugative transposon TraM protein